MPGQVAKRVKEERVRALLDVGERLSAAFREGLTGCEREVLIEERLPTGEWAGYTPQYVHVTLEQGAPGALVRARLTALSEAGMRGERVE